MEEFSTSNCNFVKKTITDFFSLLQGIEGGILRLLFDGTLKKEVHDTGKTLKHDI